MPPLSASLTPAASRPEPIDVGRPADREHHLIGGDIVAAGEMRAQVLAVAFHRLDPVAGDHVDAALAPSPRAGARARRRRSRAGCCRRDRPGSPWRRARQRCRRTRPRCSRRPAPGRGAAARQDRTPRSRRSTCSMPGIVGPGMGRGAGRDQDMGGADALRRSQSRTVWASSSTARLLTISTPARPRVAV